MIKGSKKGIDMKTAFAGIASFKKDVLIDFRKHARIGTEALLIKKDSGKTEVMAIFEPLLDMRLDECVPGEEFPVMLYKRVLERVGMNTEHVLDKISRNKGVFVECDDEIGFWHDFR